MTCRRQTIAFLAAALLSTIATPQPVTAQSFHNSVTVTIPFGFENGSQHLPPGRYTLAMLRDSNILQVRGDADGTNFMVQADQGLGPAEKGKLVFTRYGNHYFLREVWVAGLPTHMLCRRTSAEKQMQQQIVAQNNAAPTVEPVSVLTASR